MAATCNAAQEMGVPANKKIDISDLMKAKPKASKRKPAHKAASRSNDDEGDHEYR